MYSEFRSASRHQAPKLITPPSVEPFTVEEAKLHCRIDTNDEDANVLKWTRAARMKVEKDTGRALLSQTWDLFLDQFYQPCGYFVADFGWPRYGARSIALPYPPLQSVTSVFQTDPAGVETVWSATNYIVDTASEPGRIALTDTGTWPSNLRVFQPGRIRFVAGWTTPDEIPGDLLAAVALLIGVFSENREPILLRKGQTESTLYDDLISSYVMFTAA